MEQELLNRIKALEDWRAQREKQQITFPLDQESVDVLNRFFMRIVDEYFYFGGASANTFRAFIGRQDDKVFEVTPGLVRYTAEASSDLVYIVDKNNINVFATDDQVLLYTTDTAPGGLTAEGTQTYYVVSAASDGYSFKLSLTQGGAAVNITNAGVGRQYLIRL